MRDTRSYRTLRPWRRRLGWLGLGVWACLVLPGVSGAQESPPSVAATIRFLEQATFGPTPALIAETRRSGFEAFLRQQFALPLPSDPDPGLWPGTPPATCNATCRRDQYSMYPLQVRFFRNALTAPDQLRQRVAFALNQIFVISAQDASLRLSSRMLPYLQVLERHAFGNFRELLTDVTLNPGMGRYLDMVSNRAQAPNENYARELLQLFTLGVNELYLDGTIRRDAQGKAIPAYTQSTVTALARVLTGWEFARGEQRDVVNYRDSLVPAHPRLHDTGEKTLWPGVILSAGRDAVTDLHAALDIIFQHPNVGPFVGRNLIQHLVTSNPSPAYISRVAAAFNDNGRGVRGDMRAVIRQIVLDPEARHATPEAFFGHLREPVLWLTQVLRAFNTTSATTDFVLGDSFLPERLRLGEDLYRAPSVFNFFSPEYVIPTDPDHLRGPEFAIYTSATALARANLAFALVYRAMPTTVDRPKGTWLDLQSLEPLASDPQALVGALDTMLFHGTMTPAMRRTLVDAVTRVRVAPRESQLLPQARVREAVYLSITSPQYIVER